MSRYSNFSPLAQRKEKTGSPFPDFKKGSAKWFDFIEEEEYYILNGYQVGGTKISGRQYFQLNHTKMLLLGNDGYEYPDYPYYTDSMKEFYDLLEWCFDNEKNILVGKGREKGFSYNIAAIALREVQFHDYASIIALFPGGKSQAKAKFKEKYDLAFSVMPEDMRLYPSLSDSKDTLRYGWKSTDAITGQKDDEGSMSSLVMSEAVSADIAKAGRYKIILMEEFGELKKPLSIIQTNKANQRKGATKFGVTIAGGTTNAMNEGYPDFRELWHNPAPYDFVKLFVPASKMYFPFVNYETGESLITGAEEHILKGRVGLKGKELMIEMQNYPLTEAEMFIVIAKSPYDSELASRRIHEIMSDATIQNAIQIGNLYPRKNDKGETKVEFHLDPNGRWQIFKTPAKNPLYPDAGGVDVYRFNDVEEPDSKGAIVIYRPYQGINVLGNLPVMIYHHRHPNKESFFEDCLLTAMYYDCKLLIEKSDDHIFDYFKSRGAHKYMKLKPSLIGNTFTGQKADYGVSPSGFATQSAVEISAEDFKKNWQNHVFTELLDELILFGSQNTDLADAFKWAVLHAHSNITILPEYAKEKRKVKFTPYTISDGRGGLIVVNSAEKALNYGGNN